MLELSWRIAKAARQACSTARSAFKLYDTFGFPLDLTADICRERGVAVDEAGFEAAMARQREQARAAGKFKMAAGAGICRRRRRSSTATTHWRSRARCSRSTAMASRSMNCAPATSGVVVLDHTPFYAESGGQVGDCGELVPAPRAASRWKTRRRSRPRCSAITACCRTAVSRWATRCRPQVDVEARMRTMRNHSATHLMHKALREVLGSHVQQKGSLVDAEKTRFDFAHNAPMTDDADPPRGDSG